MRHLLLIAFLLMACPLMASAQTTKPATRPTPKPKHVVYFIDVSVNAKASMKGIRSRVKSAIDALPPESTFDIVFLRTGDLKSFKGELVLATPENKKLAATFMEQAKPEGEASLLKMSEYLGKAPPEEAFVTVFDGIQDIDKGMQQVTPQFNQSLRIHVTLITKDTKSNDIKKYQDWVNAHRGYFWIVVPSQL